MTETVLGYNQKFPPGIQHFFEAKDCELSSVTFTIHADDMEGNGALDWTGTINRVPWLSKYGFGNFGAGNVPAAFEFCVIRAGFDQWSFPIGQTLEPGGVATVLMPDLGGSGTTTTPPIPFFGADLFGCGGNVTVGGVSYDVSIFLTKSANPPFPFPWDFSWIGFVFRSSPFAIIESAGIDEGRITPATFELAGGTETSTGTYPTDFTVTVTY